MQHVTDEGASRKGRASKRAAFGALIVTVAASLWLAWVSPQSRSLRIDEAHKIADTYFFRLLLARDFSNPEWLRHVVDRTNPPLGKFTFGAAARLSGAPLAETTRIREELGDGSLGQDLSPANRVKYEATLRAARNVSLVATALTAGLIFFSASLSFDWIAGCCGVALYLACYLTPYFARTAVYDPLLTFFTTAVLVSLLAVAITKSLRAQVTFAVIAGLLCAAAFLTRASGIFALVTAMPTILMIDRHNLRRATILLGALCLTFAIASITANPYYWTLPRDPSNVPADFARTQPLPRRVVERAAMQFSELRQLERQHLQGALDTPSKKVSFLSETLFADVGGLTLLLGLALAVLLARSLTVERVGRVTFFFCIFTTLVFVVWIRLPWPRYTTMIVPLLSIISGAAWSEGVRRLLIRFR